MNAWYGTWLTLVVTNAIKIAGLYIGIRTAIMPRPDVVVIAFAAFMMAGAQFSEATVLALAHRFLALPPSRAPKSGDEK